MIASTPEQYTHFEYRRVRRGNKLRKNGKAPKHRRAYIRLVPVESSVEPLERFVAMGVDPGVREMATWWSTGGEGGEFLHAYGKEGRLLENSALQASQITSRMTRKTPGADGGSKLEMSHRQRWKTRRAKWRIYDKAKNQVRDAHCKYTKYIRSRYMFLLIPTFTPSTMVRASNRRIGRDTVKAMLNWRHYKQRCRLKDQCSRDDDCTFIAFEEHYTTVICSSCGTKRPSFTGKIFYCVNEACLAVLPRDFNSAKNLIIKYNVFVHVCACVCVCVCLCVFV